MNHDMWRHGLVLHHVGIGVLDLEAAVRAYEALGHQCLVQADDPFLKIRVAFLSPGPGAALIEVLAPLGEQGPLSSLVKRGILPAPYHTGYAVNDIELVVATLSEFGFRAISHPTPSTTLGGALIVFLYHAAAGLLELVQNPAIGPTPAIASGS